jgi:hypothetical protein
MIFPYMHVMYFGHSPVTLSLSTLHPHFFLHTILMGFIMTFLYVYIFWSYLPLHHSLISPSLLLLIPFQIVFFLYSYTLKKKNKLGSLDSTVGFLCVVGGSGGAVMGVEPRALHCTTWAMPLDVCFLLSIFASKHFQSSIFKKISTLCIFVF